MNIKAITFQSIQALKISLMIMGYSLFFTLFMWGGMLLVSFIPFVRGFVGAGPEIIFTFDKMVNFWMGTLTGILSLVVVAYLNGGEITINLQRSEVKPQ